MIRFSNLPIKLFGLSLQLVKNTDVVVGDVMQVDTGDKLIADGVLIDHHHLIIDEASLTGARQSGLCSE